jgi:hypothetical protein
MATGAEKVAMLVSLAELYKCDHHEITPIRRQLKQLVIKTLSTEDDQEEDLLSDSQDSSESFGHSFELNVAQDLGEPQITLEEESIASEVQQNDPGTLNEFPKPVEINENRFSPPTSVIGTPRTPSSDKLV